MSVLATDNFNRSNINPLDGSWTNGGNGGIIFQIVSNQVTPVAPLDRDCWSYYNGVTWPNDQYSQAVCFTGSGGGGQGPGLVVRQDSNIAVSTRYRLAVSTAGVNNVELAKAIAGVFTLIWDRTTSLSSGDAAKLEAQGTTLRAYINGSQLGADATDSSISSGKAGLFYSSTESSAAIDNWEGGDFGVIVSPSQVAARFF